MQAGVWQVPPTQRAAVTHATPVFWKPSNPALQTCGCAPLHFVCPLVHDGALQVLAFAVTVSVHRAPLAQVASALQPFCAALHTSRSVPPVPEHRFCPGEQVGSWQVPITQSAAVTQATPLASKPLRPALQTCGCAPAHRFSAAVQLETLQAFTPAWRLSIQSAALWQVPSGSQPFCPALQTSKSAPAVPEQRFWPGMHVGTWHAPPTHSADVSHIAPLATKPFRSALHTSGCAPLHCLSFTAQVGASQGSAFLTAVDAQRPAVSQVASVSHPIWPAVHPWSSVFPTPAQRTSPEPQVGGGQVLVPPLTEAWQSSAVAHVCSSQPVRSALQICRTRSLQVWLPVSHAGGVQDVADEAALF
jgi:hypothetical protein